MIANEIIMQMQPCIFNTYQIDFLCTWRSQAYSILVLGNHLWDEMLEKKRVWIWHWSTNWAGNTASIRKQNKKQIVKWSFFPHHSQYDKKCENEIFQLHSVLLYTQIGGCKVKINEIRGNLIKYKASGGCLGDCMASKQEISFTSAGQSLV